MNNIIICPVCKCDLLPGNNTYKCKSNHSFDISSEGYTNLLIANKKKTPLPGDNKQMVQSRKNFLSKGYFKKLSDEISFIVSNFKDKSTLLDCGTGTGYYLNNIKSCNQNLTCIGIDISKFAIMAASKQNQKINYFVATAFDMPVKDNSIDIILNIFAPKPEKEFLRVLKDDGIIIEVVPSSYHMYELKKQIYGEKTYINQPPKDLNFLKINTVNVTYKCNVNRDDIMMLTMMTPYFYKTPASLLDKLNDIVNLDITFDFCVNIYKKL